MNWVPICKECGSRRMCVSTDAITVERNMGGPYMEYDTIGRIIKFTCDQGHVFKYETNLAGEVTHGGSFRG